MNNRLLFFLIFILSCSYWTKAQVSVIERYVSEIDREQQRIDIFDGLEDEQVSLKSDIQSAQATYIYISSVDRVTDRVIISNETDKTKVKQLKQIKEILEQVEDENVHFYTRFGSIFSTIIKVQDCRDSKKLLAILKSNVFSALNLITFYGDSEIAGDFLSSGASTEPAELLRHFVEYDSKAYKKQVLKALVHQAPMKVKNYLYSSNLVQRRVKESTDPLIQTFYKINRQESSATRAYILLHDIHGNKISISRANEITSQDSSLFNYLIKLRTEADLIGEHSVNEALKYQCLKKVRAVNELHNESDAIRFRLTNFWNAAEMYTLMVYSEDEIFTSTFLGMYKRLMAKRRQESNYEFLHELNFNKFRSFIKMCAGYNMLTDFLSGMTGFEKQMLFKRMVEGLEKSNDNLEGAVAIADTYGSMSKIDNKMLLEESIVKYYNKIRYTDESAEKLYGLLIEILNIGDESTVGKTSIAEQKISLTTLPNNRIFKDGKNVQQHFFFDDPDGRSSYYSFVETFRNSNWQILDKGSYVLIKSVNGKKVEIYANKADRDFAGQKAIRQHFMETKRWPDVVVHRGHSYYASTAIESLTPNAEIVFLGSCGGYNNINQVLNYSPDAQIISSKQIGTTSVNNRLCFQLNETIRQGKDVVWETLWTQLDRSFGNGTTADSRFKDYIPPHKNLGALLIKTYRAML